MVACTFKKFGRCVVTIDIKQWVGKLTECLDSAKESDFELDGSNGEKDNGLLHWLERQLASVIMELEMMLSDIAEGINTKFMGFNTDDEFEELVDSFEIEIRRLKSRILAIRQVGRGR